MYKYSFEHYVRGETPLGQLFPKLYLYFQRWDTTGAFSEIAPEASHFEISFSVQHLYFQRWDITGAFSQIAPVVSHFENCFSEFVFSGVGHHWGIFRNGLSGVPL